MCAITPINSVAQPFIDKNFKDARIFTGLVSNTCIFVFFKIISKCAWLCCASNSAHYYKSLSDYYFFKGALQFETYCEYKDKVINFAINRTTYITKKKVNGAKELKKFYGKKKVDSFLKMETDSLYVERKKVRRNPFDRGCCFGMSLDFNARYLRKKERGVKFLKAIAQAGRHFNGGATKEADLLQIFSEALRTKKGRLFDNLEHFEMLASQAGLRLDKDKSLYFPQKEIIKDSKDFKNFIEMHPDGVYTVVFDSPRKVGHAVSLIKDGKHYYLFSPDEGTLSLNLSQFTKKIQFFRRKIAKDNKCKVGFFYTTLKQKSN